MIFVNRRPRLVSPGFNDLGNTLVFYPYKLCICSDIGPGAYSGRLEPSDKTGGAEGGGGRILTRPSGDGKEPLIQTLRYGGAQSRKEFSWHCRPQFDLEKIWRPGDLP